MSDEMLLRDKDAKLVATAQADTTGGKITGLTIVR